MATAKAKLRTSEDVYKRLKQAVQWDEDWAGEDDLWLGYDDGVFGPMEQRLSAFSPIAAGGDLPFTRIWYVRRGDEVLWDRRRRLDALWGSGDTPAIRARTLRAGDAERDRLAAAQTAADIEQARQTLARLEEERQAKLDEKRRRKMRQQRQRASGPSAAGPDALGDGGSPVPAAVPVEVVPRAGGARGAGGGRSDGRRLTLATWNCLEITPAVIDALDASMGFSRTHDHGGELAILSRHAITNAFTVSLGENTSKRALVAEIQVFGKAIVVANVHLTSDRRGERMVDNSAKRRAQAQLLRASLAKHVAQVDVFVCGDFNEPSIDGVEAAVSEMGGLVDAWAALHGDSLRGDTFDPQRNRLASQLAVNTLPRRIDRIFAPAGWATEAAALLGEGMDASDHFGVVATLLAPEKECRSAPVHTSALTLLPPQAEWQRIDAIRQRFDSSFFRWMPHINVLYGFVPEEQFAEAAVAAEAVLRVHGHFEVRLQAFEVLEHPRGASLVLRPESRPEGALEALQAALQAVFPACVEQSRHEEGYRPHLTLGSFETAEAARQAKAELEAAWSPLVFVAAELALLAREGGERFSPRVRAPLGVGLSGADAAMLGALERCGVGLRAFAVGSAALLGALRPADSDLDVLLVGSEDHEVVFGRLCGLPGVAWSRRLEDHPTMLTMSVQGVRVDVQYVRSACRLHPLHWPAAARAAGGRAVDALHDASKLRSAIMDARGLGGWARYQRALLRVKAWAKGRHVYSNALGYFGGWAWSLLLAATALASDHDSADVEGVRLTAAMFERFASWPWPQPVELPQDSPGPALAGCLPVRGLSDAGANVARNVTAATGEVHLAGPDLELCAAWVESRFVVLVRRLDALGPRPLRAALGLWAVGVGSPQAALLQQIVEDFRERLAQHVPHQHWDDAIEVAVGGAEEFKEAMAAIRESRRQLSCRP